MRPIFTTFATFLHACVIIPLLDLVARRPRKALKLELKPYIKKIVRDLLQDLEYCSPKSDEKRRSALERELHSNFSEYCGTRAWFEQVCAQAAAMAELSYSGQSFEIQCQISQFTWFMIYFDDLCHQSPWSLERFQQRMITSANEKDPILANFRENLGRVHSFWHTIPANCITASALGYINGCLLEELPSIRRMELSETAQSWPYYLRRKTGIAEAYAFMIFPNDDQLDISTYIQVIEDMSIFIDLTNDVLSFYKEHCAGEEHNYIHNRAYVTQKSVLETLQNVKDELIIIHCRITKTLEPSKASIFWKQFVNGYLAFHLTLARYRLGELGF